MPTSSRPPASIRRQSSPGVMPRTSRRHSRSSTRPARTRSARCRPRRRSRAGSSRLRASRRSSATDDPETIGRQARGSPPAQPPQEDPAMLGEFRAFLLKTNALALAIGVIIGGALGTVVTSLVNDIIMPPVGLILGGIDFAAQKWVLKAGDAETEIAIRY